MDLYYIITLFVFGIVLGSFYNVVGYRMPKKESLITPSSHCPKCNHKLTMLELIPIFSYLFQLGKCKNCGVKISPFYATFELLTGLLFALSYIVFGMSIEMFIALIFVSMTIIIFISDIHYFIILDEVLILSIILISILKFISPNHDLLISLLNGGIAFLIMLAIKLMGDFIFKKESMGGGDIKLMFVYGMMFGYEMAVLSIFIASFIGLPVSLILVYLKKAEDRIIPFGPFLSAAALIILFAQLNLEKVIGILY